jgi:hypothetical protein
LLASAWLCLAGALVHLAIPLGGPAWYDFFGAPPALGQMAARGLARPAITCVLIAAVLCLFAAYAFAGLGMLRRLPSLRWVLAAIGVLLLLRAAGFVAMAFFAPGELARVCGRCEGPNRFVLATSTLCLFVGVGYVLGAREHFRRRGK